MFGGPSEQCLLPTHSRHPSPPPRDNNPPRTVSDLSFVLKRTLKNRFGHLRLWVRLPGVTHLAFGHVCLTFDDGKTAVEGAHRSGRPPQQSEIR